MHDNLLDIRGRGLPESSPYSAETVKLVANGRVKPF